jgi:glycosyltransferase involved in cell wall biosynthesis
MANSNPKCNTLVNKQECDVVLLPSRYEGVPLVMLEAMCAGRKLLAADADGVPDMLPRAWAFPRGDAHSLADLLVATDPGDDAEHLTRHHELIASQCAVKAFGRRLLRVIDEQVELSRA